MNAVTPTPLADLPAQLHTHGWALLSPADLLPSLQMSEANLEPLRSTWNHLPADPHLRDGGHYRFRRHSCYVLDNVQGELIQAPHRAHWQPITYNALHGGFERWFEPIEADVGQHPAWRGLLTLLGQQFNAAKPVAQWFIEAHQFRVDTAGGIGRPTPEGAHRDGVDFVAVVMVGRHQVKGGETRVFEADGPHGVRFTLNEPWSVLLLDDARVIHESTPIQPLGEHGWRDTLVLTYRADGFQGPNAYT
ncbi:2OG-Fe dioxygenase family protein [Aquabacterium sp.]|uniref:2OG-Fe dioxygenase family protein n=1 Tax=Aquabacterium sp. TaxID=1872578 RepID=UPI00248A2996|nr:2OG-Fe dioxygenase family protein [Aquabacterium sp.]MDI1259925.1 2OG-Fe dioxygenase family protein [Aquabacterium sp.]